MTESITERDARLRRELADVAATPSSRDLARRAMEFRASGLAHAYVYRDNGYLLDPVSGVGFRLAGGRLSAGIALTSTVGSELLARAFVDAGEADAASLLDDLEGMLAEGMFNRASLTLSDRHERAVESFLGHHPRKLMLLVSQTCNLRCVYCYAIEGNYHDEGRKMALETAQEAIRYLARRSGRRRSLTVTLFGGEPLINFAMIRQLVPWAKEWVKTVDKRIHFCITTNGTLLTEEAIDFLILHQFSITLSLDGPKAVQDAARPTAGGQGSFDVAAPKIRRLFERHPHHGAISVRATMTKENHDIRELSAFFSEFGFQRMMLGASIGYAFHKGPLDLGPAEVERIRHDVEHVLDEGALDEIRSAEIGPYNPLATSLVAIHSGANRVGPNLKMRCGAGRNDQGVDVDGKVYPCHRYVGMSEYVIGDIWDGYDTDRVRDYYRRMFAAYTQCTSCWATRWCGGGCPHYLSSPDGEIFTPDDAMCNGVRRNLERNLAWFHEFSDEGIDWGRLHSSVG